MKSLETLKSTISTDDDSSEDLLHSLDDFLLENTSPSKGERVSIYIPAGRTRNEAEKGRIHLRTAVQDLINTEDFEFSGAVREALRGLEKLTRNSDEFTEFWNNQTEGLGVFIESNSFRMVRIGSDVEPSRDISRYWHLTPLLEAAANSGYYWLLSLSQKNVEFFRGSNHGIRKVDVPGLVTSFDESEASIRTATGDDPEAEPTPVERLDLERYFSEIYENLERVLATSDLPLVIAGVDYYLPIFEKVCRYPHLFGEPISGNPEHLSESELNEQALELLSDEFNRSRDEQLTRISQLIPQGKAVAGLEDVLKMAVQGRVKALVAPCGETEWGRFDLKNEKIEKLDPVDLESRDLYQLAAEETLVHGGRIFYAPVGDMPNNKRICAELRY